MEVLEAGSHSGGVETALVRWQGLYRSEIGEELPSVDKFQNKIEIPGVLGKSFKVYNKRVFDLRVDEVLIVDVVDLLGLDDLALLEKLKGHKLPILLVLSHLDFPESTCITKR